MRLKLNHENRFLNSFKISPKMVYIGVLLFLLAFVIVILPHSFATMQPVKSVEIFSEKLSYQDNEAGAWKVTNSAKWIGKGEAEITVDVDSIFKNSNKSSDVLFIVDTSLNMNNERLSEIKDSLSKAINIILTNTENKVSIISTNSSSEIVSDFSNDKENMIDKLNELTASGDRDYYLAFKSLDEVLKKYVVNIEKKLSIIFISSSKANIDCPREIGYYNYLKSKYQFLELNSIAYGLDYLDEYYESISDFQYLADSTSLSKIITDIVGSSIKYNSLKISERINTDYFYVENRDSIKSDIGTIDFDESSHEIIWKLENYRTGWKRKMKLKIKLKDDYIGMEGVYLINKSVRITSLIGGEENTNEDVSTTVTPIIADNYGVVYDGNFPKGCSSNNVPDEKRYSVFDIVEVSQNIPQCSGYQFKGWKKITKDVSVINDEYFVMPEADVKVRGTWAKIDIKKSMNGTIGEAFTLYKQVEEDVSDPSKYAKKYTGDSSTFTGDKSIYYYYGDAANNNVIFANYCWKIVRTTDTGGVKLLYNGAIKGNGSCDNTGDASQLTSEQMGLDTKEVAFNSNYYSLADIGYMYNSGNRYTAQEKNLSSIVNVLYGNYFVYDNGNYILQDTNIEVSNNRHYTCFNSTGVCQKVSYIYYDDSSKYYYINLNGGKDVEDALNEMLYGDNVNKESSTIKSAIDYWFSKNMISYTSYLEDTIWCNNRSMSNQSTNGWNPNGGSITEFINFYSVFDRDNLICQNKNDKFTVNIENGNGALTYPVGLITRTEQNLAYVSSKSPLATGNYYWTISPSAFDNDSWPIGLRVLPSGAISGYLISVGFGVRPAVSLRAGIVSFEGDGSTDSPYVVLTE